MSALFSCVCDACCLRNYSVVFSCVGAGGEIEVPPFAAQWTEACLLHHSSQQLAVLRCLCAYLSCSYKFLLAVDVAFVCECVHECTHGQGVASAVGDANVHRKAVVV